MAAFPDIREASRSKRDVSLLRYITRDFAGKGKDGLRATDSPEDVNALSPDIKVHVRSLESLPGDQ